jgi:hypothetical protein
MIWGWEADRPTAASPNHDESLSFLGNFKVCGVEDSSIGTITHRCEAFLDRIESRSAFIGQKPQDILDDEHAV